MERVYAFGPKGSLLATKDELFLRTPNEDSRQSGLNGRKVPLEAPSGRDSNPVSYFVNAVRKDQPIEGPVSPRLNVQVLQILDAARKSIRTGKAEELE